MPINLYNDAKFLRILKNGSTIVVHKQQIKTIDTLQTDTVRIDIGEGALKHIYIKVGEVVYPHPFASADELRDYLVSIWESMTTAGLATEVKQDQANAELVAIRETLLTINTTIERTKGGSGMSDPLRIDESVPEVVYYGYAAANTDTGDRAWAIKKATRVRDEVVYEWADGNMLFDNVWDHRYGLAYFPSGTAPN